MLNKKEQKIKLPQIIDLVNEETHIKFGFVETDFYDFQEKNNIEEFVVTGIDVEVDLDDDEYKGHKVIVTVVKEDNNVK